MVEVLPLTLVGDNLGRRHQYLNSLVNNAYQQNAPLQSILELPEVTPIDRLFKIDLASKHRHVDFIIKNLKENDSLYVSRAMKHRWLLDGEYCDIINPNYLESHLYPEMTTTAVNKMKNWIELNLKDPKRCQAFYEYYKSNFNVAIKYLWHCSKEFIVEQVSNIIDKLNPKHLRILCEACPRVAQTYFDGLQNNNAALRRYLNNRTDYFKSIIKVLKLDGDLYLDLIEKYFDNSTLNRLSPSSTRYIMENYKNRYLSKPELYAGWLLNTKTLALFLNSEEINDIVTRLAQAEYLAYYSFTYKEAEPYIKRLNGEERASIKKKIFVDKSFGSNIKSWPYPPPEGLQLSESDYQPLVDTKHNPYEYDNLDYDQISPFRCGRRPILKKCCKSAKGLTLQSMPCMQKSKSGLDTLFDRYRYENFDRIFFEFRKLLLTEGTIEGRRNMMLVLVSKAGANEAKVKQLLNLLMERHSNEPENLRDAIARSMVKRAFAWRLSTETWELFLKWATTSVREILHTTVLRHLLTNTPCPSADLDAYLQDFSDLTEYALNGAEKYCVAERLPALLISANAPKLFLDTIKAYNLRIENVAGAEGMLISAARNDENILRSVFESRIARRHLLKESFKIIQTDAAYVNALKHDVSLLGNGESFIALMSKEKPNHDRFLRALALYFSESDGLAARYLTSLEKAVSEKCGASFARPLAFLLSVGNITLKDYIYKIDMKSSEASQKKFAAALRANAFVARPLIDIDGTDWRVLGAKFVSNKALICSDENVNKYIQKCLQWKKTMRVALRLAVRNNTVSEVIGTVIEARPTVALHFFLSETREKRPVYLIWNQVKPIILNLDFSKKSLQHLRSSLSDADFADDGDLHTLSCVEADYWTSVFTGLSRTSEVGALPMLCRMENLLTDVDQSSLKVILSEFIHDKLNNSIMTKDERYISLYFRVIAKYLLISVSDDDRKVKIETICDPFFDKVQGIYEESEDKSKLIECIDDFLVSLKYSQAFLSSKYTSCIPMFEKILERMHKILPREQYFKKYVYIHVTMLYYRSVRETLKRKPQVFENPKSIQGEGVEAVGFALGKLIGNEIHDLVRSYFSSITVIYQKGLVTFFNYFEYNANREKFAESVVRGLIEGQGDSQLLARYLFTKISFNRANDDILSLLKNVNNEEMKFFLYADTCPC